MSNMKNVAGSEATKELVLFDVEEMLCGIDITHVQEINNTDDAAA